MNKHAPLGTCRIVYRNGRSTLTSIDGGGGDCILASPSSQQRFRRRPLELLWDKSDLDFDHSKRDVAKDKPDLSRATNAFMLPFGYDCPSAVDQPSTLGFLSLHFALGHLLRFRSGRRFLPRFPLQALRKVCQSDLTIPFLIDVRLRSGRPSRA